MAPRYSGGSRSATWPVPQGDGHTPVFLGKPGDEALLGVVTLEILGLVFNRTIQQMRMLLA